MAMNWAQVTQKKRQQVQIYVSKIYFYIYAFFLRFNNYIEFLIQIKFVKSFIICKAASRSR